MKHPINSKFAALGLLSASLFSLGLAGCGGSDDNGGMTNPTPVATSGGTPGGTASGTPSGTASGTPSGTPSRTPSGTPSGTPGRTATPSGTPDRRVFLQQERLARPLTNEVLATISNNRHRTNNRISPTQDSSQIANDIRGFFKGTAGRSDAVTNVAVAVLVPDVMKVNLAQPGNASFLGVETNGATGGRFGGRKLNDDVVDIDLGIIFGQTIPKLKLAPDDGVNLTQFTSDNVGYQGNGSTDFPYIAPPA